MQRDLGRLHLCKEQSRQIGQGRVYDLRGGISRLDLQWLGVGLIFRSGEKNP